MPAAASASLWIGAVTIAVASPRCTERTAASMQAAAAAPARASTRAERRVAEIGRQAGDLEQRQAMRRHAAAIARCVDDRDRQQRVDQGRGTPHDRDIAEHERVVGLVRRKQSGNDLRADAAGISHRDRQERRGVRGHAALSSWRAR